MTDSERRFGPNVLPEDTRPKRQTTFGEFRGSLPKGERGEHGSDKRARYEHWIVETHHQAIASQNVAEAAYDPEFDAVMAQPNHSAAVTRPSLRAAIKARCFQCVAGDTDMGWTDRIGNCASVSCGLHAVRPYRGNTPAADEDLSTEEDTRPLNRRSGINRHCNECLGDPGQFAPQVLACRIGNCALWQVRQGAVQSGESLNGLKTTQDGPSSDGEARVQGIDAAALR